MSTLLYIFKSLYIIKMYPGGYYVARLWNPLLWALLIAFALYNGIKAMLITMFTVVNDSIQVTIQQDKVGKEGVKATV